MIKFSQYLYLKTSKDANRLSVGEKQAWLPTWIEEVRVNIQNLQRRGVIAKGIAEVLNQQFQIWQQDPIKHIPDASLEKIDFIYERLLNFLSVQVDLNPTRLSIPNGYPFSARFSGVKIEARVVLQQDGENIGYACQTNSESSVGGGKKVVPSEIGKKLNQITWFRDAVLALNITVHDVLPVKPHAETVWFAEHAENLVNYLKSQEMFSALPALSDDFPQMQLTQMPRLEIITSSSCCRGQCRHLFSALRLHLNELNINLPIVLYADTSFNRDKTYPELDGSVYVIKSCGTFFDARVQCNVPSARKQVSLPGGIKPLISSKDQQDYACLTLLGGIAMIDLLKVGREKEQLGRINPMTYVAPDALIIYAAEKLSALPNVSAELKRTIAYLSNTLDNMNPVVLVVWRMAFVEQLHWLLISHFDPKYRERARNDIVAADMNFSVGGGDWKSGSREAKFRLHFMSLWEMPRDLSATYRKVLDHFLENSQAGMPLGVMVGPLSDEMIRRQFEKRDADIFIRNKKIPAIEVLDDSDDEDDLSANSLSLG